MHNSSFKTYICQNWKIYLLFFILAALFAVKYNYFTPKKYQAIAQIKAENAPAAAKKNMLENFQNFFSPHYNYDSDAINAMEQTVKKEKLSVQYLEINPIFNTEFNNSPIQVSYTLKNNNFYKQDFNFKYSGENSFVISYNADGVVREKSGEFGKEIHEINLNFTIEKNTGIIPSREEKLLEKNICFAIYSEKIMAEKLLKSSVQILPDEKGYTYIIVTHSIPEKSKTIANTFAEFYSECNKDRNAISLIDEQIAKVSSELGLTQQNISKFRNDNVSGNSPVQKSAELTHLENLDALKINLDLQSRALDNLSDYLRENRVSGNAVPDFGTISDPVFAQYITQLNQKIMEKMRLAQGTDASSLDHEIDDLKSTIAEGLRNTRKKVALQKEEINRQIESSQMTLALVPQKASEMQASNYNQDFIEKLYNRLADKKAEAIIAGVLPPGSVHRASLPVVPVNAEAGVVWAIAIFIGTVLGYFTSIWKNKMRKSRITNRNSFDSQNAIPYFAGIEKSSKPDTLKQFKDVTSKLLIMRQGENKQMITITANGKGQGKSYITAGLAKSFSSLGLKVLVVDMNDLNPAIEEIFETKTSYTLADVLSNQVQLQEAIRITSIPDLDILVGGELNMGIAPLLVSGKLNTILNELQNHYDYILVDTGDVQSSMYSIPFMKKSNINFCVIKSGDNVNNVFETTKHFKNDYKIENLFFILNKTKGRTNHFGEPVKKRRNSSPIKRINRDSVEQPSFLKRAALWFY